jgi:curved DNA-binding protein CbpA
MQKLACHYKTLGVKSTANAEEINLTYRTLAMKLHPDRNIETDTTLEFQVLQEAYAILSDEKLRTEYDTAGLQFRFVLPEKKRPPRPRRIDINTLVKYAHKAFNGLGYFAQMQDFRYPENRKRGIREMLEDIDWLEQRAAGLSSPEIYAELGMALRLYSVWYCYQHLGEDKKPPLERGVKMWEAAVRVSPEEDREGYEYSLAESLVSKPQVRDLKRAREILEGILSPKWKKHVSSIIRTINKWEGTPTVPKSFSYTNMTYVPVGVFHSERSNCRALINKLKKERNIEAIRPVLEHMYRMAILGEAATTIMLASDYDRRKEHIKHLKQSVPLVKQMTYEKHGKVVPNLPSSPFLSANDYKAFELVYGKTDKEFDPEILLSNDLREKIKALSARSEAFRIQRVAEAQRDALKDTAKEA